MKLQKFIEKLEGISKIHGADAEVMMADGIHVVNPVYLERFKNQQAVIVTDQEDSGTV